MQKDKGASGRWGRDILVGCLYAVLLVLGFAVPLLLPACIILLLVLFCGGRRDLATMLVVMSVLGTLLVFGIDWVPVAVLLALLGIPTLMVGLWWKKRPKGPHFDGLIMACMGMALSLLVVWGIAAMAVGSEPIGALSEALHQGLAQADTPASMQTLRILWQSQKIIDGVTLSESFTFADAVRVAEQSAALSRDTLVAQTGTIIETLIRSVLPYLVVVYSAIGGLIVYAGAAGKLAKERNGRGLLGLTGAPRRKLPPFKLWEVPRDIGNGLFLLMILALLASLFGWSSFNAVQDILYTLLSVVFFVQGLACCSYFLQRWKMKRAARIALLALLLILLAPITAPIVTMLGIFEHVFRFRLMMELGPRLKQMMRFPDDMMPPQDGGEKPQSPTPPDAQEEHTDAPTPDGEDEDHEKHKEDE
nr:DUF2232 domain-containing protein [Maliibacterium massiliense]